MSFFESYGLQLLLIPIGFFCFWLGFRQLIKARSIENVPTSKTSSAHQGYVELIGKAQYGDVPLTSPMSAMPCVWYDCVVEKRSRGKNRHGWSTVKRKTSPFPFRLNDDSDMCFIYPEGADVQADERVWYGASAWPTSMQGEHSFSTWASGDNYRYTETLITPATVIYALGLFTTQHSQSIDARVNDRMAEILSDLKMNPDEMLVAYDKDKNGEVDFQEWQLARQEAEIVATNEVVAASVNDKAMHIMQKPVLRQQPYLLSTLSPELLVKRYRWYAVAEICLGAILILGPSLYEYYNPRFF